MGKTKRFSIVSFVLAFFIAIVGFGIISNANKTVKAEDTYVAQVGDVYLASLDEVFAYIAENDGVTVKFISNVDADKSYQVPAGVTTTFDLAGNTLSCAMTQTTGNQFILNDGNLTIMDSVGGGKISYTDLGNGGEYISDTSKRSAKRDNLGAGRSCG